MSRNFKRFLSQILIRQSPACNSVRLYGRWMHRSPSKVLLPYETASKGNLKKEKIIDLDPSIITKKHTNKEETEKVSNATKKHAKCIEVKGTRAEKKPSESTLSQEKTAEIKAKREQKDKKRMFYLSQEKVFDDNGEIIYEKLKEKDPRISTLLVKLKSKKERLRCGQTLVEGWRLIVDGLEAKCNLKYVLFSRIEDIHNIRPFLPKTGVKFFKIPYKELQMWSDVETSPGILGVFDTPTANNVKSLSRPLPLQFICDNIRVPGNLGAILRIAVGAGCEKVLLSKGCVDMWDPKVIRSAAGAHFRLPIYHSIDWTEMPDHLASGTSLFIADSNTTVSTNDLEKNDQLDRCNLPVVPYYSVAFPTLNHITLILGGETEGISEESYELAASKNGLRLNIPLQRGVDSLNTGMATAVIAFEIRKQLIQTWAKEKLERQMSQAT